MVTSCDKAFRQVVEEILDSLLSCSMDCPTDTDGEPISCQKCATNRICDAVLNINKGTADKQVQQNIKTSIKGTHTATPWWGIKEIEDLETRIRIQPYTGQNVYVKGPNAPANAAYIVKCVNNHKKLVEALKWAKEHFNEVNTLRALTQPEQVVLRRIQQALAESED